MIYLGGAIRRGKNNQVHRQDREWREHLAAIFNEANLVAWDPLLENADVVDHWVSDNHTWTSEMTRTVYENDVRGMNQCFVGVFDLRALDDGYPCQGSLFEVGYMTAKQKYVIIATNDKILRNNPMYAGCEFVSHPDFFIPLVKDFFEE